MENERLAGRMKKKSEVAQMVLQCYLSLSTILQFRAAII